MLPDNLSCHSAKQGWVNSESVISNVKIYVGDVSSDSSLYTDLHGASIYHTHRIFRTTKPLHSIPLRLVTDLNSGTVGWSFHRTLNRAHTFCPTAHERGLDEVELALRHFALFVLLHHGCHGRLHSLHVRRP